RVEQEEDREAEDEADELLAGDEALDRVPDRGRAVQEARRAARDDEPEDPDEDERDEQEEAEVEDRAPKRDAAARDDVLFLQELVVGAVEARPGQQAPRREVDRASEGD